ncbi:MAG: Na+/H+ antiporter NhaC family protein, partial [Clostridia bacterium]|nr:Na+/H+ antiporter NhaC family protein [Clostridia bacterium]
MEGTFWAFMPAVIAIILALVTKQVYVSLFLGIFVGAMMYAGGDPLKALFTLYQVMSEKVGGNTTIIVFLVVLGILVVLLQKSGGAKAYGDWAGKKINSKGAALAATAGLGCLIFVDDYFNCLTVGSVMRPVTDKFKIARTKLAYIIDATAAPICIIAPISSWAAAVAGELEGDGLMVFISTIPFNVYALLTIAMVFALCFIKFDFGKMKKNDVIAEETGDVFAGITDDGEASEEVKANPNGKVRHLVIPVLVLIACCIGGMIYTGFFYNWDTGLIDSELQSANVIEAFSNCDAGMSLAIGSTVALVIISIYYMLAKVVSFKEITSSFTDGFKAMVPAILILTF